MIPVVTLDANFNFLLFQKYIYMVALILDLIIHYFTSTHGANSEQVDKFQKQVLLFCTCLDVQGFSCTIKIKPY